MALDKEGIALTLLAAAESAHSFSSYLPSYFTIKSFALDGTDTNRKLADLRSGYLPAVGMGLVLGGIVSVLAKSAWPVAASGGVSLGMIALYERAIPAHLRKSPLAALFGCARAIKSADNAAGAESRYVEYYRSRANENSSFN